MLAGHFVREYLLPYGKFRIVESEAPNVYLTDGAKPIDFAITENGTIVDLTDKAHSIYNQIKRGDIEGVKIGAGTHKRLADVPFRITSKTTGENHVVVTDDNGQFSTSADWASHKHNTNAGKTSEDGVWFGTSEPDDSKGALPYDTCTTAGTVGGANTTVEAVLQSRACPCSADEPLGI